MRAPAAVRGLPLAGCRVVVTRSREQAPALVERLQARGGRARVVPAIRFQPPEDPAPLAGAARRICTYDWVVLTSANGVAALARALEGTGAGVGELQRVPVAAIGPGTAAALRARGITPALVPPVYEGEALARALLETGVRPGSRVLVARAAEAREELPQLLRAAGVVVEVVAAYRTCPDRASLPLLHEVAREGCDVVSFASAGTASAFATLLQEAGLSLASLGSPRIACIGPITAARVARLGWPVAAVAGTYTVEGLVQAVTEAWTGRSG